MSRPGAPVATITVAALLLALGCARDDQPTPGTVAESANALAAADSSPRSPMQSVMPTQEQMAKMIAEQSTKGISSALGGAEWANRELSMNDVRRFAEAARNVRELQKDPEFRSRMNSRQASGAGDIQAMVSAEPRMREAIERSGMSVADYIGTAGALAQSLLVAEMMKPSSPMRITDVPPGVSKANVAFVQKHEAEVKAALQGGGKEP